jgi:hypothetical protein
MHGYLTLCIDSSVETPASLSEERAFCYQGTLESGKWIKVRWDYVTPGWLSDDDLMWLLERLPRLIFLAIDLPFLASSAEGIRGLVTIDSDEVLITPLTWGCHKFSLEYIRKSEMSYILSLEHLLGSSSPFTDPKSCSGCLPIWGQLSLVACSGSLES